MATCTMLKGAKDHTAAETPSCLPGLSAQSFLSFPLEVEENPCWLDTKKEDNISAHNGNFLLPFLKKLTGFNKNHCYPLQKYLWLTRGTQVCVQRIASQEMDPSQEDARLIWGRSMVESGSVARCGVRLCGPLLAVPGGLGAPGSLKDSVFCKTCTGKCFASFTLLLQTLDSEVPGSTGVGHLRGGVACL